MIFPIPQAIQNINNYKNAPVRWGGIIVDVENEQNFSLVQVLYYPLDSDGEPQTDKPNGGRFVFKTPEFLDPAVYTKNAEITVAGTLIGDIERTIGKKVMRLPLISATTIYRGRFMCTTVVTMVSAMAMVTILIMEVILIIGETTIGHPLAHLFAQPFGIVKSSI